VVLEITDELCPWNAGRWRLAGDQKTGECVRTSAPADLAIDIRELAAVYLGGTTLAALDQAALVTELRPGAITEASLAFSTPLAPWLEPGLLFPPAPRLPLPSGAKATLARGRLGRHGGNRRPSGTATAAAAPSARA
jgi:hypothetical protein